MTKYIQKSQIPTVLIFSNVYEGKYNPEDLEKIIDPMILSSPAMTEIIQINPVTKAKMKQCISRIMKGEGNSNNNNNNNKHAMVSKSFSRRSSGSIGIGISDTLLEEIHSQSGGDLRHAIMTLQFKFVGDFTASYSRDVGNIDHNDNDMNSQRRDTRLSTFHALGKLLYAKRIENKSIVGLLGSNGGVHHTTSGTMTNQYHNCPWNTDRRPPLDFNPEMVLEHSTIGLNGAMNFVQYHSADFFSNIEELDTAYSRFSDAAFLMDNSLVSFIS